jgi:hypothetical protein
MVVFSCTFDYLYYMARKLTEEEKRKIGEATKLAMKDPDIRKKISEGVKKSYLRDPSILERMKKKLKGRLPPNTGNRKPEIQKLIDIKFIWEENGIWFRKCPICNNPTKCSSYDNAYRRINDHCHKCGINKNVGIKRSDETKQKQRSLKVKRFQKLGISSCIDEGSTEYFEKLNRQGFNFHTKIFVDVGYVADGYDEEKHIWMEYDTPYHNTSYQKKKDEIRQQNIIKYFESIGNPLKKFIRVKSNHGGSILEEKCIYESNIQN